MRIREFNQKIDTALDICYMLLLQQQPSLA